MTSEIPLLLHIEAIIFSSENSISAKEIFNCIQTLGFPEISELELDKILSEIQIKYSREEYIFGLEKIAGGYQFLTKKIFATTLSVLFQQKNQKKLSSAAMETLAIIGYKQPITKAQIEEIRGVNCDYSIQKLLEKDLIQIDGKSDSPGRPLIYSTSRSFMDHFKLDHLAQLPQIKDFYPENS